MSYWRRRDERRAAQEEQLRQHSQVRELERRRKESLSMWERIEEAEASADVKEILHMMAQKLGMEE